MFNRNKRRLYIAYYTRRTHVVKLTEDATFHVALLLAPKNPSSPTHGATPDAVQYHVTNPIQAGQEVWTYEGKHTFFRDERLAALLFLGKVRTQNLKDLNDLLEAIPLVQGDPQWRCRHWVWAAIDSLVAQGILEGLPGDGEFVWTKGLQFARQCELPNLEAPLPVCNASGLRC
ncbi:hypothetical protein B0H12DRAFT_1156484 [Mycena haematopus]|nr:hypothetical protein B0H12DRAFT_1156484 [Mycena haematopus]